MFTQRDSIVLEKISGVAAFLRPSRRRAAGPAAGIARIDSLESRRLLTVSVTLNSAAGTVTINAAGEVAGGRLEIGRYNDSTYTMVWNGVAVGPTFGPAYTNFVMTGTPGADTIDASCFGRAEIRTTITGGAGDDTLVGGAGVDSIAGGLGRDLIWGSKGADILKGNGGADTLLGHGGADQVYGGAGTDSINGGADILYGDGLTPAVTDSNDTILGGTGGDVIHAGGGNDLIVGDNGAGSAGLDALYGGSGDDTYRFEATTAAQVDYVEELANQGKDVLDFGFETGSVWADLRGLGAAGKIAWTAYREVRLQTPGGETNWEGLVGGSNADTLIGSIAANTISGGAGNDALEGAGGNDTLLGGAGDDVLKFGGKGTMNLDGGAGSDTLKLNARSVASDIALTSAHRVEKIIASNWGDSLDISAVGWAMTLQGGSGNDALIGSSYNDKIYGGAGNDTLRGRGGADMLDGQDGTDVADYGDKLAITLNLATGVRPDNDTYVSVERYIGSPGEDVMIGSSGGDSLEGGAGKDIVDGNGGDDTLMGGEGNDTLKFRGAGAMNIAAGTGWDVLDLSGRTVASDIALTNTHGLEKVIASNLGDQIRVTEVSWAITLQGGSGNDFLIGTGYDDKIYGGAGDDTLRGGNGADLLDGQAGTDAAEYGDRDGIDLNLATGLRPDGDIYANIEWHIGSPGDDVMIGSLLGDALNGGAGDDILEGNGGDDMLIGEGGDDLLKFSGDGLMNLDAGPGSDILDLTGRMVANNIALTSAHRVEMVMASNWGDQIDASQVDWAMTLQGGWGGDVLIGTSYDDIMHGGAGGDTLVGEEGADYLLGEEGDDVFYARDNTMDLIDGGSENDIADLDELLDSVSSLESIFVQSGS